MELAYEKLNKDELKLIRAKDSDVPMRVLLTTSSNDLKILKSISKDIDPNDPNLKHFADRMYATVVDKKSSGVGIAAPQIGINRNVIWVQRFDKDHHPFELYINPKITWYSEILRLGREGCLSIPDEFGKVYRSLSLQLNYFDSNGKNIVEIVEGFTAVIFQHEIDHLNGILFIDRITEQEKIEFIKADQINEVFYKQ